MSKVCITPTEGSIVYWTRDGIKQYCCYNSMERCGNWCPFFAIGLDTVSVTLCCSGTQLTYPITELK